jgi:hypothetical protein
VVEIFVGDLGQNPKQLAIEDHKHIVFIQVFQPLEMCEGGRVRGGNNRFARNDNYCAHQPTCESDAPNLAYICVPRFIG